MAGRDDGHEIDYSQITENIYIGSDMCKGPTCLVHSAIFKKLGVCGEVNLEVERHEDPTPGVDVYVWLPVTDGEAPTIDQLMIGSAAIAEMVNLGNTVYVHCKNGHGRSPTLVAAYLVRFKRMTVDGAIEFIKQKRPEIHVEENQIQALIQFKKEVI